MLFYVLAPILIVIGSIAIAIAVCDIVDSVKLSKKDDKAITAKKLLNNAEQAVYLAKNYNKESLEMALSLREEADHLINDKKESK